MEDASTERDCVESSFIVENHIVYLVKLVHTVTLVQVTTLSCGHRAKQVVRDFSGGKLMKSIRGFLRRFSWIATLALAVPLLAVAAPFNGADLPNGLQPTQVNVTNDVTQRYGEPEIAVNPRNPNNMVYAVMSNKSTYACQAAAVPNCTFPPGTLAQPLGFWASPGWYNMKVFVTFNRGKTWKEVSFPSVPAFSGLPGEAPVTDHSDLITKADPMVTVTANGTFYLGWDAQHMANVPPLSPPNPPYSTCCSFVAGGIAVSKSTNGGRTWSTPYLTGTGVNRPWMTTDLSTGRVYEASSGGINGLQANGNPAGSVASSDPDRYVVSSTNGVNWTTPQGLGAHGLPPGGTGFFSGANASTISAANGQVVAGFRATSASACAFFVVSTAPCTVFQTSTDSGATWSRHAVPVPADSTGSVLVAADPTDPGTSTVAVMNSTATAFLSYVTHDNGVTWSGPTTLTDDSTTVKFKTWINYSPDGLLGLAWRSRTLPGGNATTPYLMFAATSDDQGATWSDPLQISTAPSPGSDPLWLGGDRDDTSVIVLSKHDVLVGWGDWRPGEVQGFFSAIKRQAFRRHDHHDHHGNHNHDH